LKNSLWTKSLTSSPKETEISTTETTTTAETTETETTMETSKTEEPDNLKEEVLIEEKEDTMDPETTTITAKEEVTDKTDKTDKEIELKETEETEEFHYFEK
jgi:hypothetical protein